MSTVPHVNLPKWPQMCVSGVSVSEEQAKEIILRTDMFLTDPSEYSGGNARQFNAMYRLAAGLEKLTTHREDGSVNFRRLWDLRHLVREKLGVIDAQYVHNNWASSAFIGGPHGWCAPDGTIAYSDNVGKWPSENAVYEDWVDIAEAFPFLQLKATLYSGESGEDNTVPVITFIVSNGNVTASTDPAIAVPRPANGSDVIASFLSRINGDTSSELGLPITWYDDYAKIVHKAVDEAIDELIDDEDL